jgi:hypothetical protein
MSLASDCSLMGTCLGCADGNIIEWDIDIDFSLWNFKEEKCF